MDIVKETVIYSNTPFKKFRWVSYYSMVYVSLIAINFVFLPLPHILKEHVESMTDRYKKRKSDEEEPVERFDLEHMYQPNPQSDNRTLTQRIKDLNFTEVWTGKYLVMNLKEKPLLVAFALSAGILVPSLFSLYLRRVVHMITLLPNNKVRFEFFSPMAFAKPPKLEVPLNMVSCQSSRNTDKRYSILKIKGYRGFHLVSKTEGKFHHPDLYDHYLGYARSWAN